MEKLGDLLTVVHCLSRSKPLQQTPGALTVDVLLWDRRAQEPHRGLSEKGRQAGAAGVRHNDWRDQGVEPAFYRALPVYHIRRFSSFVVRVPRVKFV